MTPGISIRLAFPSLHSTFYILEIFDVQRTRSTVHNWVHKPDLQPTNGQEPNHVAVNETVIQFNEDQYWLYAVVDPETNESLNTKLELTINSVLAQQLFAELREKHDLNEV